MTTNHFFSRFHPHYRVIGNRRRNVIIVIPDFPLSLSALILLALHPYYLHSLSEYVISLFTVRAVIRVCNVYNSKCLIERTFYLIFIQKGP